MPFIALRKTQPIKFSKRKTSLYFNATGQISELYSKAPVTEHVFDIYFLCIPI